MLKNLLLLLSLLICSPVFAGQNVTGNLYVSGNVGIGSTTPNSLLNVLQGTNGYLKFASVPTSYTGNLTGNIYTNNLIKSSSISETVKTSGLLVDHTDDQTANNTVTQQGIEANVSVPTTNTFNNGSLQALVARSSNLGTGTSSSMFGLNGMISNAGGNVTTMRGLSSTLTNSGASNTVGTVTGLYSVLTNSGAGSTVTDFDGIRVLPSNSNATAQVTNFRGLNISDLTNTGTIASTYGVYVGDITTGTQTNTPFSVYASDASAFNYFAGNTGIGTSNPTKSFCVGAGCAAGITSAGAISGSGTLTNSGTIYSDRTATNSFALNSTGANFGNIFNVNANAWSLGYGSSQTTLGTPVLTWNDSGNLGIGTTVPSSLLQVSSGANIFTVNATGGIRFGGSSTSLTDNILSMNSSTSPVVRNNNSTSGSGMTYKGAGNANSYTAIQSTFGSGTTDYIKFTVGSDGATEAMRIQNNSGTVNVGIGTAIPSSALTIKANYVTTKQSAANQACDTTCGAFACFFGGDTASGFALVDCSDATADVCICSR